MYYGISVLIFLLSITIFSDNKLTVSQPIKTSTAKTVLAVNQLPAELQQSVNLKFTAELTDLESDFVDFQIIDNGQHGMIELGSTRIVFIDHKLETFRSGFINIVEKRNYTDHSTFSGEHIFMTYAVNEFGTHIQINNRIRLLIKKRVLKLKDMNILLDDQKKVVFIDLKTAKAHICYIRG